MKRNALLSSRSVSWGAVALVVSLFILGVRFAAPNLFWQAIAPVFRASDAVTAISHSFFGSFSNAAALAAESERLTAENTALASENQALLQKVSDVSALLGVSGIQKNIPGILAGVVARPPASPYDTLVLAAGTNEGVALGMEAFGEGGVPLGIVSSVRADFSRVTLFSAPGVVTGGWIGQESIPLSLVGAGAGAMQASIARVAGIIEGDVVFVPGPGQLPIGSVVRVDSDPLSPGVTLRIQPALNPFGVAWVVLRMTGVVPMTFATSTTP